jgi:small subunit ribosomal protein S4
MLNGRRVDIPSIRVNSGDNIVVRDHSKNTEYFRRLDDIVGTGDINVSWLKIDRKKMEVAVTGIPTRDEAEPEINEQLIVEYYSR